MDSHLEIVESDPVAGRKGKTREGPKINHGNVHFSSSTSTGSFHPSFVIRSQHLRHQNGSRKHFWKTSDDGGAIKK